jgi:hypothetical protein
MYYDKRSRIIGAEVGILPTMTARAARAGRRALHVSKMALLCEKPVFLQPHFALGRDVLLARNNTVPLVHHQIGLAQLAGRFIRGAVPNLHARTNQFLELLAIDSIHPVFALQVFLHYISLLYFIVLSKIGAEHGHGRARHL